VALVAVLCLLGSPLSVTVIDGCEVMSVTTPMEPSLVDNIQYVSVKKNRQAQTERLTLSQCQLKVTGTSVCLSGVVSTD